MRRESFLWSVVLAMLFLAGLAGAYLQCIPLEEGRQVLWLAVILWPVVCGLAGRLLSRYLWFAELVPAVAGVVSGFILGPEFLVSGLLGNLNYLISWWNLAYEDGKSLFLTEGMTQQSLSMFALVLFCFLAAFIWHWLRRRSCLILAVFCLILLMPGLILDRFSAVSWGLVLAACVGSLLRNAGGDRQRQQAAWALTSGAVLLAMAVFCGGSQVSAVDQARGGMVSGGRRFLYGEDTLPQGVLADAPGMLEGEDETLVVGTEQVKQLYLRGFVGDRYEDGCWKPLKKAAFGGSRAGMLDWLARQNLEPAGQYAAYLTAGQGESENRAAGQEEPEENQTGDPVENQVFVRNTGAVRKYMYLPYSAEKPVDARQVQDARFEIRALFGAREYRFTERSDGQPSELIYLDDWFQSPENEAQQQYVQAEEVYRSFVYQNYTELSPAMEELMDRIFVQGSEPGTEGIYHVTQRIRTVLSRQAVYRDRPEQMPEGREPVRWFLTEGGEGNAVLFASAAVEAYRAFGIPARYVEGYLLKEEQCAASADGVVHLTNQDSHAWVEVYMDGIGWLPVDVTPGYYYDTYALMEMLEYPSEVQRTAALEEGEESAGEVQGEESTGREAAGPPRWEREILLAAGFFLAGICLICSAVLFILELRRFICLLYIPRRLKKMEPEKRIGVLCRIIERMMVLLGIPVHLGWQAKGTEEFLCSRLPAFGRGEYERINGLVEKYTYGDGTLAPHEERALACFAEKLYRERKNCGFWKRIRLRYL